MRSNEQIELLSLLSFFIGVLGFVFFLLSAFFAGYLWFQARKNIFIPFYVLPFWPDSYLDKKGRRLKYYSRKFFMLGIVALIGAVAVPFFWMKALEGLDFLFG